MNDRLHHHRFIHVCRLAFPVRHADSSRGATSTCADVCHAEKSCTGLLLSSRSRDSPLSATMKAFKEMVTGGRSHEGERQYEESQDPSQIESMGGQQPDTGSYYAPPSSGSARTHVAYGGQQQYGAGQEMERGSGGYYDPRGSQGTYQGQHPQGYSTNSCEEEREAYGGHQGKSHGRHGGTMYKGGEEYDEGQRYGRQSGYGGQHEVSFWPATLFKNGGNSVLGPCNAVDAVKASE